MTMRSRSKREPSGLISRTPRGLVTRHATKRRAKLVDICRSFPEATVEAAGQRHLAFKVRKKTFAYYLNDHHGDGKIAFCCKAEMGVQQDLVEEDSVLFFVPPYLGPKGWVAIRLDLDTLDWALVGQLARKAYQMAAPRKLAESVRA